MQSEAKIVVEVEIDFDVVPDKETVTAVLGYTRSKSRF